MHISDAEFVNITRSHSHTLPTTSFKHHVYAHSKTKKDFYGLTRTYAHKTCTLQLLTNAFSRQRLTLQMVVKHETQTHQDVYVSWTSYSIILRTIFGFLDHFGWVFWKKPSFQSTYPSLWSDFHIFYTLQSLFKRRIKGVWRILPRP